MPGRDRTTEYDKAPAQRAERGRPLAAARWITDEELAAFTAGGGSWAGHPEIAERVAMRTLYGDPLED